MQSKQKKILVVDDEPDILAFLQALLEQEGYTKPFEMDEVLAKIAKHV